MDILYIQNLSRSYSYDHRRVSVLSYILSNVALTHFFSVRKWRVKRDLCRNPDEWEFEVGEDVTPRQFDLEGLRESSSNVGSYQIINEYWIHSKLLYSTCLERPLHWPYKSHKTA